MIGKVGRGTFRDAYERLAAQHLSGDPDHGEWESEKARMLSASEGERMAEAYLLEDLYRTLGRPGGISAPIWRIVAVFATLAVAIGAVLWLK